MGSPAISSPAPSPAPSPNTSSWFLASFFKLLFSDEPKGELLRIELSVLLTTIFLFLLLFLGRARRSVRFGWFLKYLTKIIYILIPISITYIMGLMHNASTFHVFYPFWACILVYAYGGVVTITACDFSDNDHPLSYFWRTLPLLFWTGWLGVLLVNQYAQIHKRASILYLLVVFLGLAILNTIDTLKAFYKASKSKGLPSEVNPTVKYMDACSYFPQVEDQNSFPMRGYKYLVWDSDHKRLTTNIMWIVIDLLFPTNSAGRERLKDLCFSHAFFRLILRRFANFPLSEISEPKNMHFIREGLLAMDLDRVFHIIEVELQFLFDFFYTKSHLSSQRKFGWSLYFIGLHCLYTFMVFPIWINQETKQREAPYSIQFHGHSLEAGVTYAMSAIYLLLECWKLINALFSNQTMVLFICYLPSVKGWRLKAIKWIWNIKDWVSSKYLSCLFKPWRRQLGQYSFLESYSQVPLLAHCSWFGNFVKIPQDGQTGESSVELSTGVKQAIVTSLLQLLPENPNDKQTVTLSRGRATIARYRLSEEISHTCQLETDTHVILVWHIATSLCARSHPLKNNDRTDFLVATQLSNYCAYLVTFAPELLPVHPFTTDSVFEEAVKHARSELIHFNLPEGNAHVVGITMNDHPKEVVALGKMLAARLLKEETFSPNQLWAFLAEFWAELLLYLAPSDNVDVHGEYLASGGEFITHLWALLTHAGVVNRSINCVSEPKSSPEESIAQPSINCPPMENS